MEILIRREIARLADPARAKVLQGFFKTGPGEYAEGDRFLGLTVPQVRGLVRAHWKMPLVQAQELLRSPVHEERLAALLILTQRFEKGDAKDRESVFRLYLSNTAWINNWDLVDLTAPRIVGVHLLNRSRKVLEKLARSENVWERRIAIVATFAFITRGESATTLRIAEMLLDDPHDLIHKACGWMLREVGKRCSREEEEVFLDKHAKAMPRTMLRYAIERFPVRLKRWYMKR